MAVSSGPKITKDGLVLYLDAANFESFRGEPTTNLTNNVRDFSGTSYAQSSDSYSNIGLNKTYISNLSTPIGSGGTLISISGSNSYHALSRWGGSGEGSHYLSCYVKPLVSGISDFALGLLNAGPGRAVTFNLDTKQITFGSSIVSQSAFIEDVKGWPGWKRLGANIEGRYGGWVGSIGFGNLVQYQGVEGDKPLYITGVQYETGSNFTAFVEGSRGTTVATGGGWADMTNNGNHAEFIGNVNYISDYNGSLYFPTGSDYGRIYYPSSNFVNTNYTWCAWVLGKHSRAAGITHNMPDIGYGSFGWPRLGFREVLSSGVGVWQWMAYKSTGPPDYSLLNICDSSDSDWIFLSVTADYTNNFIKVYSNGEYKDSSAYVDTSGNGGYFGIGKGYGTYSGWNEDFQGKISNVMIFNRALSQAEIKQIYEATRARYGL